tara:strand:+ start:67 stop:276 length:210 start_codon:yes stop_codon:yes gene_type:complete
MNEEKLNMSLRKFLKNVGINSQRLIEDKVREAVKSGQINDSQKIKITAKIHSDSIQLSEEISGELDLEI